MLEPIVPNRYDLTGGRFYEHDGIMKPSATTVLKILTKGKYFDKWAADFGGYLRLREYISSTADSGSRVHLNAESLISGLPVITEDMERDEIFKILAFVDWVNAVKPQFIGSEVAMWHKDYPIAGTADIICRIKNQLFLIDIKTGKNIYDYFELQTTGYGRLYEKIYGEKPELSILHLKVSRGRPKYEVKRYGYNDKALESAVNLWNWRNPVIPDVPKPRREIPKIIQLDKEFINVEEPTE